MSTYTVKRVADSPREWSSKQGGTFLSYTVDLEDEAAGKVEAGVEWNRKPESKAPEVGDRIAGTIEPGKFSERFKMDFEATKELGSGGGSTSSSGGTDYGKKSGGGNSWKPRPPEEIAGMRHAHSLLVATQNLTPLPVDADQDAVDNRLYRLRYMSDRLDLQTEEVSEAAADANNAASGAGAATSREPTPSPSQTSDDSQATHELLYELFEKAGEAGPICTLLTDWVISTQEVSKQDEAIAALRDDARKAKCVQWARAGYEKANGALPTVAPSGSGIDDDIPFARPVYPELFSERERRSNRP